MNNLQSIITYINKIDIAVIKKGKRIFENEYVFFNEKKDGKLFFKCHSESSAQLYDVVIHLENLLQSNCSCPAYEYPFPCKHLTACFIKTKNTDLLEEDDFIDAEVVNEIAKFPKPALLENDNWIMLPQTRISVWQFLSQYTTPEKNRIRKDAHPATEPQVMQNLKDEKGVVTIDYINKTETQILQFKAAAKNIYTHCTCDFESHFNSLCKHKVTALMFFQTHYGEDYFFRLLDFTDEKNALLAEYGLTLLDEDAQNFQFLFQNNQVIIESKNSNIVKASDWDWLKRTTRKIKEKSVAQVKIIDANNLSDNIIVLKPFDSYPGVKLELYPVEQGSIAEPQKLGAALLPKVSESYVSFEQFVSEEAEFAYNLHYLGIINSLEKSKLGFNNYYAKSMSGLSHLSIEQQNLVGILHRDTLYKFAEHLNTKGCVYWENSNAGRINASKIESLKFSTSKVKIKIVSSTENSFVALSIVAIIDGVAHQIEIENIVSNALLKFGNTLYAVADENHFSVVWEFKNKPKVLLPAKDMNMVVHNYLRPLESIIEIELPSQFVPETIPAEVFEKNIRLSDLAPDFLLIEAFFKYNDIDVLQGTNQIEKTENGHTFIINRNVEEEQKHIHYISTLHPKFIAQINRGFFYLKFSEALQNNWFFDTVKMLEENGVAVYGKNDLKLFKYSPHKAKFELKAGSGIDWFDIKIELSFGDEIVPMANLKKAIVDGQEFVLLSNGAMGVLPQEWSQKLKAIFKIGKQDKDTGNIQLSKLHFTLIDELSESINDDTLLFELAEKKRRLAEINTNKNYEFPKALKAELRPYQQSGYQWFNLLHEMGWGGCLADDMGLGKTLQAITFIQKRVEDTSVEIMNSQNEKVFQSPFKALIVGPTSLVYNWENEFKKFAPEIKYYIHHGSEREAFNTIYTYDWNVCITSYGTLRNDIEKVIKNTYDLMILDESQAIKNAEAQLSKAVKLVPAKQRFIMSGTPVQNNTFDLYAQFDFINPALLGSKEFFKGEFANAIDKNGDAAKAEQLRKMVFPFLLRRTKETVAKDLPEKIESVIYCEMESYQRKVYEKVKEDYRAKILQKVTEEGVSKTAFLILEGLTKLRMLCDSPSLVSDTEGEKYKPESIKLEELTREIQENISNHKILVFSQFLGMLDLVRKRLDADNIKYVYLDGSTPATERQNIVTQFQEDESIQIFLMSLKAGGVGLTLTAADYVYIVDPWWNPAVEDQAIDRTHRIGQDKAIFAYKMICKDSIEEKIILLQQKKKSIANELISEDASFVKKLTKEDLEYLFE